MRSIWDKYYSDAHGVMFVVDAADVARFEEARLAFGEQKRGGGDDRGGRTRGAVGGGGGVCGGAA
jgi:hypothetical protein